MGEHSIQQEHDKGAIDDRMKSLEEMLDASGDLLPLRKHIYIFIFCTLKKVTTG
jgi:hypothetical protein